MSEGLQELASRLVVGRKRDGRCVYDEQAKAELVAECAKPGASVSRLAREVGVNANQLSRWVREHGAKSAPPEAPLPAVFVPVAIEAPTATTPQPSMSVQARLPNGVVLDVRGCDLGQAAQLLDTLGRLRCSGSTKG
jgi:transposase